MDHRIIEIMADIEKYLLDTRYFAISKDDIKMFIEKYGRDNTIDAIVFLMAKKAVPFPYAEYFIDDETALSKFRRLKQFRDGWNHGRFEVNGSEQPPTLFRLGFKKMGMDVREFMLYEPRDEDYQSIDNLTCAFTDRSRMSSHRFVDGMKTFSPEYGWNQYGQYVRDAVESLVKNRDDINAYTLREGLYVSSKRKGCPYTECAHERLCFISLVFRELILHTADKPLRIFDACAGWGDRLIMAMALDAQRYVGVEPNSLSKPGFDRAISLLGDSTRHQILCDGCPEVILPEDCVDGYFSIAFLSPPAFTSEFYSSDPKQSVEVFHDFDSWMLGFLIPTINLCWRKIDIGGVLVIQSLLAAKINSYIESFCVGSKYLGTLAIKTGRSRNKPLWVWKKTQERNAEPNMKELETVLGKTVLRILDK